MLKPNLRRALKPTLNRFMGGGDSPPAVNYVARLDGVSQYWDAQTFQSANNEDWSVSIYGTFSAAGFFVTATRNSGTSRLLVTSGGDVYINDTNAGSISSVMSVISDGGFHSVTFEKTGGVMHVTVDGTLYILTGTIGSQALTVNSIGSKWGTATGVPYFSGVIKDVAISIAGVEVLKAQLTDKDAGATQQAEIGGTLTMANYSPDVWEVDTSAN